MCNARSPAILGMLVDGLIGPVAPVPDGEAAARAAVQDMTLMALRALGVIDARARGLVAQVALPYGASVHGFLRHLVEHAAPRA